VDLKNTLAPYAIEQGRIYDILPAFIMAVASLETGNGSSTLCTKANNLFSIKGSYNGNSVTLPTTEYVKNKPIRVNAAFKKYPSFRESCHDFCELMKNGISWNPTVYKKAVIGVHDLTAACIQFGKTPYMTDPAYSGKLLGVIKSQDLAKYDQTQAAAAHKSFTSIVDFLKSKNIDSSFSNRAKLARAHGIMNYSGTTAENTKLLTILGGI